MKILQFFLFSLFLFFRASLYLIEDDNSEINEEYDLINSLQILNDFNVDVLPLQVRLSQDRIKLIELCLKNQSDGYKSTQRLLNLANYLRIEKYNPRNRDGKVLELIAEKAYEVIRIFYKKFSI